MAQENTQDSVKNFLLWESFDRTNKQLFFGRDREAQLLYDKTFTSNLLLLYGPSGAGKTSLVRCGLGNMFEKSDWYPIFIRKGDHIVRSLSQALKNASADPVKLRNSSIREKIHELFLEKFRPIFLIFDQFEELFILGNREEQEQFFNLLIDLMNANFQCKIILSLKENYLADLDIYEEAIPVLFYNRMRVERMRIEQLEQVVRGMTNKMRIRIGGPDDGPAEEQKIINSIFTNVRDDTNRIDLGELQLFMDELYSRDELRRKRENNPTRLIQFDRPLVEHTEYVDVIINRRLQKQLEDLDFRFKNKAQKKRLPHLILRDLVTELETKRARTVEEIEKHLFDEHKILPIYIEECIQALVDNGILRNLAGAHLQKRNLPINRAHKVEIIHDNLAKKLYPILFSEEQIIIRVKNVIAIQYETYLEAEVKLSKDDLEYIQPYLAQIREDLPPEHIDFVEISRKEVRKRVLRLGIFLAGLSLFLLLSTVIAITLSFSSSRKASANVISAKALGTFEYDRTRALRMAQAALEKDEDNLLANNVINDVMLNMLSFPFYQDVYKTEKGINLARISDLDISKGSDYLLAGCQDGSLYLLNFYGDRILKRVGVEDSIKHTGEITDVDFIDDFTKLNYPSLKSNHLVFVTSSKDGYAKLWQLNDDSSVTLLDTFPQNESISAVAYREIGDKGCLFVAGEESISQWTFGDTLTQNFNLTHTNAFELVKYGNTHYLLAASRDSTLMILSLSPNQEPVPQAIPGGGVIVSMDFDKSDTQPGRFIAGLEDGRLMTWTLSRSFLNGTKTIDQEDSYLVQEAHSQAIKDVVFVKGSDQILTSSRDKSAKLWNIELKLVKTFLGHNDGVQTVTSDKTRDGLFIYTGGEDRTIKKWKLGIDNFTTIGNGGASAIYFSHNQGALISTLKPDQHQLFSVYNVERNTLGGENGIELNGEEKAPFSQIALSPVTKRKMVALAGWPDVYLLSENNKIIDTLKGIADQEITSLAFSPDGDFFLTVRKDSTIIWKRAATNGRENNSPYRYFCAIAQDLCAADLVTVGDQLLLVGAVRTKQDAYVWSIPTVGSKVEITLTDTIKHKDEVLSVAISTDGLYVLAGNQDNSFSFSTRSGVDQKDKFDATSRLRHNDDVKIVAFSPSFSDQEREIMFLTASQDGQVRLWDKEGWELKSYINHGSRIINVLFLTKNTIVTLGVDGIVKKWDTDYVGNFISNEDNSNIYQLPENDLTEIIEQ
jgi:WD40 repeat protein/energy-coupling factor transporter ATP-binding protein EcfA2